MLAPRSARAKHSSNSGKSHGIRNLPGSPNFSGNVFRMTAEQFSLTGVLVNSKILIFGVQSFLEHRCKLRHVVGEHPHGDRYGKVVLDLGMTTGSSTWTIGGWTSLVLLLGGTVSIGHTRLRTSTTGVLGYLPGHISIPTVFGFMVSNDSDCWLGCCVAWEENRVQHRGDTPEVEALALTLATMALTSVKYKCTNFGLAFDDDA
ncbi:hypothetical protein Tco_0184264 [Tanacetum coccineum]